MPQLLNHVQPGQIITSDMWNLAVDAINNLLQASQAPGITIASVVPAGTQAEPIRVSTQIQITGRSFGYSLGTASVSFESEFGTVQVTQDQFLIGSSDTRLLLVVPPMSGLSQSGANMTLRVSNGVGSDTRSVFVIPFVIPLQGHVFVSPRADVTNPNPNPITAAAQADFAYQLQTDTNMSATFDLSVDIPQANTQIPQDLVKSIVIFDANNPNEPTSSVLLGRHEQRNILVRIPSIPASFDKQTFTLSVRAASGQVVGEDSRQFTVGTSVTPPDPTIQVQPMGATIFTPTGAQDTSGQNGSLNGTSIQLRATWQMIVSLSVTFLQAGTYDVSAQSDPNTTGWLPSQPLVNTLAQYQNINAGDSRQMSFMLAPTQTATATGGSVLFRVKNHQSAASDQTRQYSVKLL